MNNLLFLAACVVGIAIDLSLLFLLLRSTSINPVLRLGRRNFDVSMSPFVISSEADSSHLLVKSEGGTAIRVHVYVGEDQHWRIANLGAAPVELNGRPLRRVMRLFDGNKIGAGSTTLLFKDFRSAPIKPRFKTYKIHPKPYVGGSSLVYPASRRGKSRQEALLKVRDPSREDEEMEGLNARIKSEFDFLKRAHGGAPSPHARLFPAPYELLDDGGGYYAIAMENVRGTGLSDMIERRKHRPLDILRFSIAFARALERLEEVGIVHCDLKPGNVVLRADRYDDPCLVDFGIAVETGGRTAHGTRNYKSPEHGSHSVDPLTPRSDVYVMGLILRTALQRCAPDGPTHDPLRAEIERLIDAMQRPSPQARPSARQVRETCERLLPR